VATAQILDRHAAFRFAQEPDDLLFGKSRRSSPSAVV
jgi:hypothetical protein